MELQKVGEGRAAEGMVEATPEAGERGAAAMEVAALAAGATVVVVSVVGDAVVEG